MIIAAAASPRTIWRRISSRLATAPRSRKFPVFSMAAMSARLSLDRDSSSTMVGRLRTSVWMAKPNSISWIAGTPDHQAKGEPVPPHLHELLPQHRPEGRREDPLQQGHANAASASARSCSAMNTASSVGWPKCAVISSGVPSAMRRPREEERQAFAARGLVHVVRGQQDRGAARRERADVVPEPLPRRRVDARCRLVEEEQVGLVRCGAGEGQALLPSAAQRRGQLLAPWTRARAPRGAPAMRPLAASPRSPYTPA